MGQRVGLVAVLVRHHEALVLGDEVLGQSDRAVGALRAGRVDDLRAEQRGHLAPLVRDVVGHDERHAVALAPADHRQRDAGVPGRRLEDDRVLVKQAPPLEVLDEVLRDAILDRPGRVEHLELGEDADVRVRAHPRDLDHRRVPDRVEDVRVPPAVPGEPLVRMRMVVIGVVEPPRDGHGQPPAMAGSRRTSSVGATGVSRPAR